MTREALWRPHNDPEALLDGGRSGRSQRHHQLEKRTLVAADNAEFAPTSPRKLSADKQPNAHPPFSGGVERLENLLCCLVGNAWPVIVDAKTQLIAPRL